ncbi:MAG TPA: hypothetical protein VFW33_18420 [Gemmataceae bacterium]|nr:hypothetical protein [Gemmataceae bacterium]
MNTTVDLGQGAELRVGGSTVGVYLPEAKFRELVAERDALRRELEDVRRELEAVRQGAGECERLKRELSAVKAESDQYNRTILALLRESVETDEGKWNALISELENGGGGDLAEVVREIEQTLGRGTGEDVHAR